MVQDLNAYRIPALPTERKQRLHPRGLSQPVSIGQTAGEFRGNLSWPRSRPAQPTKISGGQIGPGRFKKRALRHRRTGYTRAFESPPVADSPLQIDGPAMQSIGQIQLGQPRREPKRQDSVAGRRQASGSQPARETPSGDLIRPQMEHGLKPVCVNC